jgi:phenylacetate-CoA ligase
MGRKAKGTLLQIAFCGSSPAEQVACIDGIGQGASDGVLVTARLAPEALTALQLEALRAVLAAAATVPFYRERFEAASLDPARVESLAEVSRLPPLERSDVQRLGVAGLSVPGAKGMTRITSGSSGQPVRVLWGHETMRWVDAVERRLREWLGVRLGEQRVQVRALAERRRRPALAKLALSNTIALSPAALADPQSRGGVLKQVAGRRFPLVMGSGTGLYILARALGDESVTMSSEACVSGGNLLLPHQRATIEEILGCRVHERYASIETGMIATPCPERCTIRLRWRVETRDFEPGSFTFEDTTAFTSAATFHPLPERRIRLLMTFFGLMPLLSDLKGQSG